jgi:hypothetical protein
VVVPSAGGAVVSAGAAGSVVSDLAQPMTNIAETTNINAKSFFIFSSP